MDRSSVAQRLRDELGKYGTSELTYSVSLFSGERSRNANVAGTINGRQFKVIMFDGSEEEGMPSVSAHFTSNMNVERLSPGHLAYWNADNRFSKMYRQDEDVYVVMDAFLTDEDGGNTIRSVAKMWDIALKEIPKFKTVYERMKDLF